MYSTYLLWSYLLTLRSVFCIFCTSTAGEGLSFVMLCRTLHAKGEVLCRLLRDRVLCWEPCQLTDKAAETGDSGSLMRIYCDVLI